MDFSVLTINTVLLFLLMLIRITGMIVAAPFFSQTGVPVQVQVGLSVALSVILFPLYSAGAHVPATDLWAFSWVAGQEFVIGLLLGFVASLMFASVQMAGSHVTNVMGLGVAQAIDPISNEESPIMGQFYFILAMMLFLGLRMHHTLIIALVKSFDAIPLASGFFNIKLLAGRFMDISGDLFALSVMLILPVMGMMLVMEIALAFVAKIMPQMNIFMVALPLKIAASLLLVYATLPFTQEVLAKAYEELAKHVLMLYQS